MTIYDPALQADDLAAFVSASPSSFHAVAAVAARLDAAGFVRLDERDNWDPAVRCGYVVRDGSVVAWVRPAGEPEPTTPFRIIGAHTDSPGLVLKPRPTTRSEGWLQAAVEVYGGPVLASWFDRELEAAGRVVTRDGVEHLVRTGPFLRVPHLAIHLDRSANESHTIDRQRHLQPVFGVVCDGEAHEQDLLAHLAHLAGVDAAEVVGHDVTTVAAEPPARFGAGGALLASARLDNLLSVHAGLTALLAAARAVPLEHADVSPSDAPLPGAVPHTSVLAAFDHEEIGSASRTGAEGPVLADVLTRLSGGTLTELARAYAASWCVSSDVGHAVHPNHAERHDPSHHPVAGGGPLLKVNANQRYASDAHGAALWAAACEAAGTQSQPFVSHNGVPCGSTIGPATASRLGIRTVDVGAPILSMHSARELAHIGDVAALAGALTAFLAGVGGA